MIFQRGSLILLLFPVYFVNADIFVNYSGFNIKVLEQSGKTVVGNVSNLDVDPNSVKLQFAEIKEKDSNGSEVGKSMIPPHTFSTFTKQSFSFSNTTNVTYQNITATMFNFTANLAPINATLRTSVYLFKEEGKVTDANETTNIKVGNVKFIINIMNWKFCGSSGGVNCKQGSTGEVGRYIDFSIVISGNRSASNATKETSDGDVYNLGGGAGIILSKKVKYDDRNWTNMTTGYPKMTTTGKHQMFTFRLENFNTSAQYSLTVAVGNFDGETGNRVGSKGTTVSTTVRGNGSTVGGNGTTGSGKDTTISNTIRNSSNTLSLSFLLTLLSICLFYFCST
ncbi:hypothetical protein CHS0354_009849 [Potamilus streckersoni]|uniref:Uncharacterized protein n=1 Tax=Potamilus streckersoni TaxID=2493646 RepID=A0AAE0SXB1_9BIVA|nr:hypothetical protein CHS0354_009849 [Potamilus streckersoni]